MDFLLFDPGFILGNITGVCIGGVLVMGLVHYGAQAAERRIRAEADLTRERVRAAQQTNAWERASAANDEGSGTRRAQMRGGPR